MEARNRPSIEGSHDRGLGLPELIAIGVGGMIGGGIFSILGLAVDVTNRAAPLAFVMGGVIAAVAGYSYVRLALTFRNDGASYVYLRMAFPTRLWIAGIAGWTVVVGYIGTLALYAFTFGAYSAHLFGLDQSSWARILLSSFSLILFLTMNLVGVTAMGRTEDLTVYIKIALLAVLAGIGLFTADPSRLAPTLGNGVN
jgi:amino acid transporter